MNFHNNHIKIKGYIGNIQQLHNQKNNDTGVDISVNTEDLAYYEDDERKSKESWHKVESWGPVGDSILKNADVGDKIEIIGQLRYKKWTDDKGTKRTTAYIKPKSFDIVWKKNREEAEAE